MTRGKPMTNLELATSLGSRSTVLGESLASHIKEHGTLVPHVFMTRVLDHVRTNAGAHESDPEIAAILESLELGLEAGDRETRNVISMSFLSEAEREPFYATITPLLGPRVRAHYDVG